MDGLANHSAVIQKANDCVKAAQDEKALKTCREAFHKELKEMKEKHKAEHVKNIDEKIKKLEEKKEELKNKKN
jgi:vacuolar-type H+-ATPase subunit I/STV1